jgi:hypothetical protein
MIDEISYTAYINNVLACTVVYLKDSSGQKVEVGFVDHVKTNCQSKTGAEIAVSSLLHSEETE